MEYKKISNINTLEEYLDYKLDLLKMKDTNMILFELTCIETLMNNYKVHVYFMKDQGVCCNEDLYHILEQYKDKLINLLQQKHSKIKRRIRIMNIVVGSRHSGKLTKFLNDFIATDNAIIICNTVHRKYHIIDSLSALDPQTDYNNRVYVFKEEIRGIPMDTKVFIDRVDELLGRVIGYDIREVSINEEYINDITKTIPSYCN